MLGRTWHISRQVTGTQWYARPRLRLKVYMFAPCLASYTADSFSQWHKFCSCRLQSAVA